MRRRVVLLLALAAAAPAAGCGATNPALIPADRASALQDVVDKIDTACQDGDAPAAQDAVNEADAQINELPASTDRRLRRNLRDWVSQIDDRLDRDCKAAKTPTPTPSATDTPTPTPTAKATPAAPPRATASDGPPAALAACFGVGGILIGAVAAIARGRRRR
jgi:hypothetical protein